MDSTSVTVPRLRLAVLIGGQGRGSNMANLITAGHSGRMPADVVGIIAPKGNLPAVERAAAFDIPVAVVEWEPSESFGERLLDALTQWQIDVLCLAGFLRKVPESVIAAFPGRIINIHPALLPKFGGKGMYGSHVHEAVLAAGEAESGCSVHLVSSEYDEGAIIHQRRCPVLPDDTSETLGARVLEQEHFAYPEAIEILHNRLRSS